LVVIVTWKLPGDIYIYRKERHYSNFHSNNESLSSILEKVLWRKNDHVYCNIF